MTDHLAEARRITEGQTAYDSTSLSCGILHALIAIAERMGEGRAPRCPATRTNAAGQRFGCSQLADHEGPHATVIAGQGVGMLEAVLPDLLAEAWDEGHHAGHEDARAVQATYPEPTPNPYRTEETR